MTPDKIAARKAAAMKLLANGDTTVSETAELAGVSRQAVRKWVLQAKLDPVKTRRHRLRALWASATATNPRLHGRGHEA
jgi:transposase-like protein